MKAWEDLLQVAITGTDRRGIPPDLAEQLTTLPLDENRPAPEWLIEAAAWLQSARRAQPLPELPESVPSIPLPEADPRPTAEIGRELDLILNGPHRRALPELLDRLEQEQMAMPREHLPALLDLATKDPALKPKAEAVWGPTGRWLQQQNPDWGEREISRPLENLDLQELLRLRRSEPEIVFKWVQAKWAGWKAPEKTRALKALKSAGPFSGEHRFLKTCLQERSQNVRELTTELLLEDPDSSLSHELWEFLKPQFSFSERKEKKELHIDLPSIAEMNAQRFFLKPRGNARIREELFGRMLAFVPPDRWEKLFNCSTGEVIDLFSTYSEIAYFLPHLMLGGKRFHAPAWCTHILKRAIDRLQWWNKLAPESQIQQLSSEHWNQLAAHALRKPEGFFDENSPTVQLLRHGRHLWTESISLAFFRKVLDWITQPSATPWNSWLYQSLLLEVAAYHIPPGSAGRLQAMLPADQTPWAWREPLDRFYASLLFRAQLHKKIRKGRGQSTT